LIASRGDFAAKRNMVRGFGAGFATIWTQIMPSPATGAARRVSAAARAEGIEVQRA